MNPMFRGTYDQRIDEKGRVNIPQRFREALGKEDRICITNSRVNGVVCLDAYPYTAWAAFEERLEGRTDLSDDDQSLYLNYYLPGVQECQLDRQGRILLPPRLREHAQLSKDVVFVGQLRMFRLFDRDARRPIFASGDQVLIDNPRKMPGFGI
jgi:MraZ protein